jgi:hypothetical protein
MKKAIAAGKNCAVDVPLLPIETKFTKLYNKYSPNGAGNIY